MTYFGTPVHVTYNLSYVFWALIGSAVVIAVVFAIRADLRNRARSRRDVAAGDE